MPRRIVDGVISGAGKVIEKRNKAKKAMAESVRGGLASDKPSGGRRGRSGRNQPQPAAPMPEQHYAKSKRATKA